jgi:flap endonuclease-1
MGIHNLNKFLRNNCPLVYENVHISEYAFKKVAIDISLYLCKYKIVCGNRWLSAFINLVACLRRNEIHCVFIYDSGAPPEKDVERKERASAREKSEAKVYALEEALNKYYMTEEIDQILIDLCDKKDSTPQRLLGKTSNKFDINWVEAKIAKMRSYILDISPQDFALTKQLFTILDVPFFDAPLEAETMCSDLCKRGLVDAVVSEDTDVLAYASPVFLTKLDTTTGTCVKLSYPLIIESLGLSQSEFLDLCIMCGTDYNKNIIRVGPEKAYKLIQKYSTIENIEENTSLDISILHHVRGRELFVEYEKADVFLPYCGTPDFEALKKFVFKNNLAMDIEGLRSSFTKNLIVFEE